MIEDFLTYVHYQKYFERLGDLFKLILQFQPNPKPHKHLHFTMSSSILGQYSYVAMNNATSNIQSGLSLPGEYKYVSTNLHIKLDGQNICSKSLNQYIQSMWNY